MIKWLQGKKTYIGALAIATAVTAGYFYGLVSATDLAVGLGVAVSVAGLSAKLNRYLPQVVSGIEEVKQGQYSVAAGTAVGIGAEATGVGGTPSGS
jgi:hypothetical protein